MSFRNIHQCNFVCFLLLSRNNAFFSVGVIKRNQTIHFSLLFTVFLNNSSYILQQSVTFSFVWIRNIVYQLICLFSLFLFYLCIFFLQKNNLYILFFVYLFYNSKIGIMSFRYQLTKKRSELQSLILFL